MATALFRQRFRLRTFLLFAIMFFVGMILFRRVTVILLISLAVAIITYFNYSFRLPFDLSPVLVVSLVISRQYSWAYSIIFIIISGVIPMILAGGSFDHTTLFYASVRALVNLINSFLVSIPLPILILMCILDHLLGMVGSVWLFGGDLPKELVNLALQTLVDLIYIFMFLSFLIFLL